MVAGADFPRPAAPMASLLDWVFTTSLKPLGHDPLLLEPSLYLELLLVWDAESLLVASSSYS